MRTLILLLCAPFLLSASVRTGFVINILGAEIAADGTIRTRVKFTDRAGSPLERDGISTAGTLTVSFIAAVLPRNATQYTAYTTRVQTSPINGVRAVQAAGENTGTFTRVGPGEYTYQFTTRAPANLDRAALHAIGAYGSRNLSEFGLPTQYDDGYFTFVPSGGVKPPDREVVKNEDCNACHHQLAFHGGSRRTVEVCNLCHTPQTVDPDTGNTVDMPVMIHKIHMGANLPSVRAGQPYQIIGNAQSLHDYSKIVFPADIRDCGSCHRRPENGNPNYVRPNRKDCGACHETVNFATGENHANLPQPSDNQCATCHQINGEYDFDISLLGAHTIPQLSTMLDGVRIEIQRVDDTGPGQRPLVTFTLKNKHGANIAPSVMARLALVLTGPAEEIRTYTSESVITTAQVQADGRLTYRFTRALPNDASGTWAVYAEGRREVTLLAGTTKQRTGIRDTAPNKVFYFSVNGVVKPREQIVAIAKCNACHNALAFHGQIRNDTQGCVVCHNPTNTGGGQAIDFKTMIHRIHTGAELEIQYAFGNTSFNGVHYTGDRRKCDACHVNGSEQLPLRSARIPVADPASPINPIPPVTAACTSCHSGREALSHAVANTTSAGESCATCHGRGGDFAVDKVHRIE